MGFIDRFKRVWNAFKHEENTIPQYYKMGNVSSIRPDRVVLNPGNERSIVTSMYNRIAVDVAALDYRHVDLDKEHDNRYKNDRKSKLNRALTISANKDQTPKAFIKDAIMSLIDEGCIAIVPVDIDVPDGKSPFTTDEYDIISMRVGKVIEWYPDNVKVRVYNDRTGRPEDLTLPKEMVAIVENPFYQVMNAPNSTYKRLIRKLNLLDYVDEQSSNGKLDLIIQLPYVIKTPERRKQADMRRTEIEEQLRGSKYGIAYTDGTEHITQLNRPVENNLLAQVKELTSMLQSQLYFNVSILDGTADEKTMLNYMNGLIKPFGDAIVDEMRRKFLSPEAISQGQSIMYFNDPFKIVPITTFAEISDKFTRNEVMSPNEMRQKLGLKPNDDPKSDELRNRNIGEKNGNIATNQETVVQEVSKDQDLKPKSEEGGEIQNG